MKTKQQQAAELADELLRLNALVRARRAQLARLEKCPFKDCECRRVWRDVVEKDLAGQMGKISRSISNGKAKGIKGRKTRSR